MFYRRNLFLGMLLILISYGQAHATGALKVESPYVDGLSVVAQWNELALAAVRSGSARPTATTWQLFMVSTAMYDALAVYSKHSMPYALPPWYRQLVRKHTAENRQEAVSHAAFHMLNYLFPEFEKEHGYFRRYLHSLGYTVRFRRGSTPSRLGYRATRAVIKARRYDGSNHRNDFEQSTSHRYPEPYTPINSPNPNSDTGLFGDEFDPNRWQPLRVANGSVLDDESRPIVDDSNPDSFDDQEFLSPHWGAVTPFSLTHGAQYRPPAPPQFGSYTNYVNALGDVSTNDEAYRSQFDQVRAHSASLDDSQKAAAEFWADGPRTESPPGHWNQLAHGLIERDQLDLEESVHLFFALNGALLDAGIATWEAKRAYDFIRPVSAIRWLWQGQTIIAWGGPNHGTEHIQGEDWIPYQSETFVTPPFAEYVSGHSTFSRAAAEVLTHFSGSGTFYDGVTTTLQDVNSDGEPDFFGEHITPAGSFAFESGPTAKVVLQWPTFIDAANEAGLSRIYGGIHIQDGDLRGRELGRTVGIQAFYQAQEFISGAVIYGRVRDDRPYKAALCKTRKSDIFSTRRIHEPTGNEGKGQPCGTELGNGSTQQHIQGNRV